MLLGRQGARVRPLAPLPQCTASIVVVGAGASGGGGGGGGGKAKKGAVTVTNERAPFEAVSTGGAPTITARFPGLVMVVVVAAATASAAAAAQPPA